MVAWQPLLRETLPRGAVEELEYGAGVVEVDIRSFGVASGVLTLWEPGLAEWRGVEVFCLADVYAVSLNPNVSLSGSLIVI